MAKYNVGDIVQPNKGPHKGIPHEIIHVSDTGYNIKPVGLRPKQIKYRLGAAHAKPEDLKEETSLLAKIRADLTVYEDILEMKKVKLSPGQRVSGRAFKKMKAAAKLEVTKRSAIKTPKAPKKVVIPKTKTPEIGVGDEKHPLEWILKNSGKQVRSKLVTQVHPADRGRVQNILVNDPEGVNKFMSGKVPFRRIA